MIGPAGTPNNARLYGSLLLRMSGKNDHLGTAQPTSKPHNDAAKHYSTCEQARGLGTACDWSLQESCKLLMAYSQLLLSQRILWVTDVVLRSS